MTNEYRVVPVELLENLLDSARLEVDERVSAYGEDYRPHVLATLRKVITDAEAVLVTPVLPVGGEPEVLGNFGSHLKERDLGVKHEVFEIVCTERDALKAEVERLTEQRDERRAMVIELSHKCARSDIKAGEFKSELTKAREMLTESHDWVDKNNFGGWDAYDLRDRLAASIKPKLRVDSHE